eukprot:SAG11_NODE_188_length_13029_cov_3.652514_7_plen_37_part_00
MAGEMVGEVVVARVEVVVAVFRVVAGEVVDEAMHTP